MSNSECLECKFSEGDEETVETTSDTMIPKVEKSKYLGSIIKRKCILEYSMIKRFQ